MTPEERAQKLDEDYHELNLTSTRLRELATQTIREAENAALEKAAEAIDGLYDGLHPNYVKSVILALKHEEG